MNLLKQTLQRTRDEVSTMVAAACVKAENLQLKCPTEKRRTKTPARLRHDGEQGAREDDKVSFETYLSASFRHGLDMMLQEIDDRFSNEGMNVAVHQEKLIMHSATDPTYVDGIEFDALALPPCFDRVKLAIQIKQLKDFLAASGNSEEGSTAVAEISYLL